jgi:hypothetical protein
VRGWDGCCLHCVSHPVTDKALLHDMVASIDSLLEGPVCTGFGQLAALPCRP